MVVMIPASKPVIPHLGAEKLWHKKTTNLESYNTRFNTKFSLLFQQFLHNPKEHGVQKTSIQKFVTNKPTFSYIY